MTGSKSDREAFLLAIRANPDDAIARLVFADWCQDHDDPETAAAVRAGTFQATTAGARIVVVGEDGGDPARPGCSFYTMKIYEAVPRKADGVLTWRLVGRNDAHRMSGMYATRELNERARAFAAANGMRKVNRMRHGTRCD